MLSDRFCCRVIVAPWRVLVVQWPCRGWIYSVAMRWNEEYLRYPSPPPTIFLTDCPRPAAPEMLMDKTTDTMPKGETITTEVTGDHLTVTTKVIAPTSSATTVTKVIVAVHGVGDQYRYATIQSVVNQFCGFNNHPAAIPLGNFHTGSDTFPQPPTPTIPTPLAFAEVYWRDSPRPGRPHKLRRRRNGARTIASGQVRWHDKGPRPAIATKISIC